MASLIWLPTSWRFSMRSASSARQWWATRMAASSRGASRSRTRNESLDWRSSTAAGPHATRYSSRYRPRCGDIADPIPTEYVRAFQASTAYEPLPAPFFERIVAESLKLPPRLWGEAFDRLLEYEDTEDLPRITAPTLVLWGDRDALFSRDDQDRLAAAIPGAALRVYPEIGHCPNWECPDDLADDLGALMMKA